MHSRQASKFALYRAQGVNRGYSRGKGLAFVTGEIRDSDGYPLLIRRHCTGYVVSPTLYPMHALCTPRGHERKKPPRSVHRRGRRCRTKKYPVKRKPYGVCNERDVVTYSTEGLDVNAPRIPAIVIVTSPINIEPNDCNGVNSAFPA